ncbi:MAG: DNA-binding protein [Proteobacteria bacterium]|nr:MAG: DNA-binding protein [Pseudomonadota bacterium]
MPKPKTPAPVKVEPIKLIVPKEIAKERIEAQIAKGLELKDRKIAATSDLDQLTEDEHRWHDFNKELLINSFSSDRIYEDYKRFAGGNVLMYEPSPVQRLENLLTQISTRLNRLRSVIERLDLLDAGISSEKTSANKPNLNSSDVFVVHGHDRAALAEVAQLVRLLGLNPIVLHEKPNEGKTIIEKFEAHSNVDFAVVLLTPDDEGRSRSESGMHLRARQNVIMELGYFMGKLGRSRVCALYKEVELPSDISGVVYIGLDNHDGWKFKFAKELKQAGFPIDLNKL